MRRLGAALLLLFLTASPAVAYLVEVTRSVAVSDQDGERTFDELNRPESVDLRV